MTNTLRSPDRHDDGQQAPAVDQHADHVGDWLHRANRYDWQADGVERVTGKPPMSVREFVSLHANAFGGWRS